MVQSETIASAWVNGFGGQFVRAETNAARRLFDGKALLRVRATVAHDSYERLVEVGCTAREGRGEISRTALGALPGTIEAPSSIGLDVARLSDAALVDPGIDEFSRFYLERRDQECLAASNDERKRKKLFDEFTPRIHTTLVGLEGTVHREVTTRVRFKIDGNDYESEITAAPVYGLLIRGPTMMACSVSGKVVPQDCIGKCAISGDSALRHLLFKSDISGRLALEPFTEGCTLSGVLALQDEVERSDVTGNWVNKDLLKQSALSKKMAEPQYFKPCDFTGQEFLHEELGISQFSSKAYRIDQGGVSALSGKTGHKSELVDCYETRQTIGLTEAERCEESGKLVRPGVLVSCDVTAKRVLSSEVGRCNVTKKRALKRLLVSSSISRESILAEIAVKSKGGAFCSPAEVKMCIWSGRDFHPDDLRVCSLTGITIQYAFVTSDQSPRLRPLAEILDGSLRAAEKTDLWERAAECIEASLSRGSCRIQSAVLSPTGRHLAMATEVKTFLGMRTHHAGAIYSILEQAILGRIVEGRRADNRWKEAPR